MHCLIRLMVVSGLSLTCAAPVLANSFSLYYEADGAFPEQENWTRWIYNADPAYTRAVEGGVFRTNSLASPATGDLYSLRSSNLMPDLGEFLRVDWCMRVLQQDDTGLDWFGDAGMHIGRSYSQSVSFYMAPDSLSVLTPGASGYQILSSLEPRAWHTYSLLTNMDDYDLYVDGRFAFHSVLYTGDPDPPDTRVSWGDTWSGAGSESEWDYVRVSIVPEPGGLLLGAVAILSVSVTARKGVEHD